MWVAAKLYPAGATTNSASGVTDIDNVSRVLERMQKIGMPLLVHGEVTDPAIDIFDREAVFIDRILLKTLANFPALKIVLEHITTRQSADLVISASFSNLAATITPQHLMLNRNALFDGGLRPHAYCLPVVKREEHRLAVRKAAVSGSPNVFLGTDSAPHTVGAKESGCGCAGLFNAPFALEAYAQVFDEENALDRFEGFASENGAALLRPAFERRAPSRCSAAASKSPRQSATSSRSVRARASAGGWSLKAGRARPGRPCPRRRSRPGRSIRTPWPRAWRDRSPRSPRAAS